MAKISSTDDPVDRASNDSFPASDPPSWTQTTVGTLDPTGEVHRLGWLSVHAARHWWLFALRGGLALVFGVLAVIWPLVTLYSLVLLFAAYCLFDALFAELLAIRGARHGGHWIMQTLHALLSFTAAAISLFYPHLTLFLFAILIAAWALASGIVTLVAAFRLRHDHGRWWMIFGGMAALFIGIAIILYPPIGLFTLVWFVAVYALLFGATMLMLARRLRTRLRESHGAP